MNHSHSRCKLAAAFAGLLATLAAASAQTGPASLAGHVTDGSKDLPLAGTRVTIPDAHLTTYTDRYGDYAFADVPTGNHEVHFSYVGYPEFVRFVTIAPATSARLDARYRDGEDVVNLETLVIEGTATGTARAINQQRAAPTLVNIVAADEIGRFPDQNAAEALQRVPGVSLYRDQGEGRFVIVRGINYTLNTVTLNGASLASPEEGDRGVALDVISSDALAAVEVTKVPMPDMDAEGLGGKVNIKTKSPFDYDGLQTSLNVEGLYSDLTGELGTKLNGSFSTISGDRKIGFLVAPTWQKRKFGSYNFEEDGWMTPDDTGTPFYALEAINFRDYQIERERYRVTAALETKPQQSSQLYLRANYHRFTDNEYRNRSVFDFSEADTGAPTVATASSATFDDVRRWRRDIRFREKDQELLALAAGGDTQFGDWQLDGAVDWSRGHEENPGESSARFRHNARDGSFHYTFAGPYDVTLEQLAGADIADPTTYTFQRVDYSNDDGDDDQFDLGFNARRDFQANNPWFVKFGATYRTRKKDKNVEAFELTGGPADFTYANLAEGLSDYPYLAVPRLDGDRISQAFFSNFDAFDRERIFEDSELEDWISHEDVLAGYLMGETVIGRTTFIAGVRIERTEFDTTGNRLDLANEVVLGRDRQSRNYTNWLPGVYLRHDMNPNLVLRASFSTSLARPSFGESAAFTGINDDDEEVMQGNPALAALTSNNWDASVEYYLPSLGLVSAGVFYKQVDNFSYQIAIDGGYAPLPGYELTTYRNGSDGEILGLELSYQQQLRSLPAPFDGLGVMANLTLADSRAKYPDVRPGETLPFIGMSDVLGNAALTYEKGGVFVRAALNFRSDRLREDEPIGGDQYEDRYVDDFMQFDVSARYRCSENWEVFVEWVNATNEPFRVYFNSPDGQGRRLVQFEEYGWSSNFGVRWRM